MRKIISILAVAGLVAACSPGSIEDISPTADDSFSRQDNKIVGGSVYEGLPAVGALVYNGNMHCTGTLIAPRKVLTAGHCVSGFSASRMQFVIGPRIDQAQYVIDAASIQAHPYYNGSSITNDIGLVILKQDAPIAPLGINTASMNSWKGTSLFFVGYGVNNGYNQTGAGIKRAVWMDITGVSTSTFSYENPDKNTCNGDSGGPAFLKTSSGDYLVAGVTSYGDQYCNSYGVDTRVDAYLDFVGETGGSTQPDQPADPCNGETYEGRCDGDTVVWCENDQVNTQDCAASGKGCGWSDPYGYYGCITAAQQPDQQPEQPADPCNGETWQGRCEGDTVIWCENDQVNSIDCGSHGASCGWNYQKGYYDCI